MKRYFHIKILGSVVALGLVAACGTPPSETADNYPPDPPPRADVSHTRNAAQYHDDAGITNRVLAAVVGVPGMHANSIQVSTYDGIVTLRGTAANEMAARNAVQAARQVTGVRSVDYDLQVSP